MAFIYREWRIAVSILFAVVLIAGSYLLATGAIRPQFAEASTNTALLAAIANKDSNGDGLPDWEKSLYGIPLDATTTDYFGLGMTDGEAVAKGLIVPIAPTPVAASSTADVSNDVEGGVPGPAAGSLTDAFAKNFFTLYTQAAEAGNGSLTDDQVNDLANEAVGELQSQVAPAPDFKTAANIKTGGTGQAALRTYAAAAEAVADAHNANLPESEMQYLQDYVAGNSSPSTLGNIATIAQSYQDSATGLAALTVPTEAKSADLEIINAEARLGEISGDFARIESDPLSTMLALQQYPAAVQALTQGFADLAQVYQSEGIVLETGQPGASFVNVVADVATQQASQTSP